MTFIVLARLLDPRAIGLVALATVFVAFMQVFVDQGFGQALVQREEIEPEHLDSALWSSLAIGCVLTLAVFVSAHPIANLLHQPAFGRVLQVLGFALLIGAFASTPQAILSRELAFGRLAARQLVATVGGSAVGIACAFAGFGVWSLVAQTLSQATLAAVILWIATTWRPRFRFSRRHFRELFGFGSQVVGINLLNFANRRGDDLLIGAVLGPTALGLYTVAYNVLLLVTDLMIRTIDFVAFPVFARLQADAVRLRRAFLLATTLSATVAVPVFLGLAALAPLLIDVTFGAKWHAAVRVMQVLSFIGILHASLFFNDTVMLAAGRARAALTVTAANAVSNVVAFAIAVHWGIVAVAAAYVIRGYLLSPLPVVMVRRVVRFSIREYVNCFAVPIACASVTTAVVLALRLTVGDALPDAASLVLLSALGAAMYIACLRVAAPRLTYDLLSYAGGVFPPLRRWVASKPGLGDGTQLSDV